jgi:hypothetical protein
MRSSEPSWTSIDYKHDAEIQMLRPPGPAGASGGGSGGGGDDNSPADINFQRNDRAV